MHTITLLSEGVSFSDHSDTARTSSATSKLALRAGSASGREGYLQGQGLTMTAMMRRSFLPLVS
jgi:hypothetical protein